MDTTPSQIVHRFTAYGATPEQIQVMTVMSRISDSKNTTRAIVARIMGLGTEPWMTCSMIRELRSYGWIDALDCLAETAYQLTSLGKEVVQEMNGENLMYGKMKV